MDIRSPGQWLQVVGVAHAGVGLAGFHRPLTGIARARLVGAVPDRGERAMAFWFMVSAPAIWVSGRLLRSAELAGDLAAQRAAGRVLAATGLVGVAAMPGSGFWAILGVGLGALRRGGSAATGTPPTARAFDEFAGRQSAMYAGGDAGAVRERLAPDVVWHVPGTSAIAGDHRGRDAVLEYFTRRRALAGGSMTITPRARLVFGDVVVQLADGAIEREGRASTWRTAGVYRMRDGLVAEAWLVPLESASFEAIWRDM